MGENKMSGEFEIYYPPRRWWRRALTVIFPFINIALAVLVIWLVMRGDEFDMGTVFQVRLNWGYMVGVLVLVYLVSALTILQMQIILKTTTGKTDLKIAAKTHFLERFWTMMTPFMSGGRPSQVYYFHKHGYDMGKTTSVVVSNYIVGRIGFQLLVGVIWIFLMYRVRELDGGLVVGSTIVVGIVFAIVLSGIFVFMAFSKIVPEKISKVSVWILFKIRIIKDRQRADDAMSETLWTYRVAMRKLLRQPLVMWGTIALSALWYFLHLFKIVFIYAALWGFPDASTLALLILGITLVENTAAVMPLPGGTGGMEIFFLSIFATIFGSPEVVVAVVLWKIVSYVMPIVNGLPFLVMDSFQKRKNTKECENSKLS
ncbi:MAG: flippase-like domain-containing protein [Firmicutes bacterium]|nr:flippase-like domain-containing protein [Bacillota bacterium]